MRASSPSRRAFLQQSARVMQVAAVGGVLAVGSQSAQALATSSHSRALAFEHLHTNERLSLVYAMGNSILPQAQLQLDRFLRDHYTNEIGTMDPQLFDLLYRLRMTLDTRLPFHVISGYRSPFTNERLRTTRSGGVARRSLHMDGKAIDIRIPGIALADLRDAAISLKVGGVGFYSRENFVHVDTGAVRSWGR